MTRTVILTLCLAIGLPIALAIAHAREPQAQPATTRLVRFAGVLTDASGGPLTGPQTVTFTLFDQADGGAALWSEALTVTADDRVCGESGIQYTVAASPLHRRAGAVGRHIGGGPGSRTDRARRGGLRAQGGGRRNAGWQTRRRVRASAPGRPPRDQRGRRHGSLSRWHWRGWPDRQMGQRAVRAFATGASNVVALYGVSAFGYGVVGASTSGFAGYFTGTKSYMQQLGVGTHNPADTLDVEGDARVGTGTTGCVKDRDGTVITATCLLQEKHHAVLPEPSTNSQLRPVHFDWRADEFPDHHFGAARSFGLFAQDVEAVLPELVVTYEGIQGDGSKC